MPLPHSFLIHLIPRPFLNQQGPVPRGGPRPGRYFLRWFARVRDERRLGAALPHDHEFLGLLRQEHVPRDQEALSCLR